MKLLDQGKTVILCLALFLFSGLLLIGKGFTGMYLIDFEQDYCSSDSDCLKGNVCCNFYKENSGVCDKQANCKAIEQLTREEKEKISSNLYLENYKFTEEDKLSVAKQISSHIEKPASKNSYASIISGAVLLIMGVVWIIYLKRGEK